MWKNNPSIVHQDVSYTVLKQFSIHFAIGRKNKPEDKKQQSGSSSRRSSNLNSPTRAQEETKEVEADKNQGYVKS